jgi:hypothetical protein
MFFRCEPGAHASMVRLTYTKPNAQALLGALPLPHPAGEQEDRGRLVLHCLGGTQPTRDVKCGSEMREPELDAWRPDQTRPAADSRLAPSI